MHYEPWLTRVTGQLLAAYKALEYEIQNRQSSFSDSVTHASIAAAIAWQFTQSMLNTVVLVSNHPGLADLSVRLELTPEFRKYPAIGPGI